MRCARHCAIQNPLALSLCQPRGRPAPVLLLAGAGTRPLQLRDPPPCRTRVPPPHQQGCPQRLPAECPTTTCSEPTSRYPEHAPNVFGALGCSPESDRLHINLGLMTLSFAPRVVSRAQVSCSRISRLWQPDLCKQPLMDLTRKAI